MSGKKKTRAIKDLTATNRELKKELSGVRGQLTKAQTKLAKANERVDRWKKEAAAHRTAASRSDARVSRLRKKLDRAKTVLEPRIGGVGVTAGNSTSISDQTLTDGPTVPDTTWTVVQLRAEARARGLSGMSNKSKSQLLAALNRTTPKRRPAN